MIVVDDDDGGSSSGDVCVCVSRVIRWEGGLTERWLQWVNERVRLHASGE